MKFHLGEIALGQNFELCPEYNGMECEIVGNPQVSTNRGTVLFTQTTALRYLVKWSNGQITAQEEFYLKKLPPSNDLSSWEDSDVWQPEKELVYV